MPILSIIIPVYNKEERLRVCLNSVLQKAKFNIEIIIIEDKSTDNSRDILYEFESIYDNVFVIYNEENKGAGYSRNVGVKKACGKYLWFVDADDTIKEGAIDTLIECAECHNLDVLFFDIYREGNGNRNAVKYIENSKLAKQVEENIYTGMELFEKIYEFGTVWGSACRQIINRDFCLQNNIFFPEGVTTEDTIYSLTLFIRAVKVQYISKEYYSYFKFDKSVTYATSKNKRAVDELSAFRLMVKMIECFDDNKRSKISFCKYLRNQIKAITEEFRGENEENFIDYIEKTDSDLLFWYTALFSKTKKEKQVRKDINDVINKYDDIIIYGAGVNARLVIDIIDKLDKRVIAYAISREHQNDQLNPKYIFGVPVLPIDQLVQYRKDALVIIAAESRFIKDIYQNLIKYDFINIQTMF